VIREAGPDDLGHVVEIGRAFHAVSLWAELVPFDEGSFAASAADLIGRDSAVILLSDAGFLGLTKVGLYFNRAVAVTAELFFWAPDGMGDDLRRAGERGAGGLLVMNAHGGDDRAGRWYARHNYRQLESTYLKAT